MKQDSWYKTKDALPSNRQLTVAVTNGFDCTTGFYNHDRERWFVSDITAVIPSQVKYWIYLPEEREDE